MRLKKRNALLGAVVIIFGCLIVYRIVDHNLPQQENSYRFIFDSSESRRVGKPLSFENVFKKNISKTSYSKKVSLSQCKRPINIPRASININDLYKEISFDNIDGGVWKQGWEMKPDPSMWNKEEKLRVFIVPHSHNDPGWLKTFEEYYQTETRNILGNMLKKLSSDRKKRFIYAEISFFSLWWDSLSEIDQERVKGLINNTQLEIVTGGWVMNDEANTHYYSMLTQLTEGHQWMKNNLGYHPKNGWTIDPFGESPTMTFMLKKMGLENLVIHRVHYSVKKFFAQNQALEFRWRQMWDREGTTDLFTHVTPFFSYDIPHTCGPDPKICCQFDFKRLPGSGISCPWKEPPKVITKANVATRAKMLLEQYQMKAQLYRTSALLVPLGDDFRYETALEWDSQFENYYKLINYINSNPELNAEVQFGTLKDYFDAVKDDISMKLIPSLVGDFFTYADRDDHYWSGYYTSRPFYKRMDRVLIGYHRTAEIIFALACTYNKKSDSKWLLTPQTGFAKLLRDSRQNLGLFQHHDGVTGTARDNVMEDYASKLLESINNCKHIIQQVTHFLLSPKPNDSPNPEQIYFEFDEHKKNLYFAAEKYVIILAKGESKSVVFFNSLTYRRKEVVSVLVFSPNVVVEDSSGKVLKCQISPYFSQDVVMDEFVYEVSFEAEVPALGFNTYKVTFRGNENKVTENEFSKVKIYNAATQVKFSKGFENFDTFDGGDFSIDNQYSTVVFGENGLLKSITDKLSMNIVPVHLDFVKYSARAGKERSGAYLFLPQGEASIIKVESPLIRIMEGPLFSRVFVKMPLVKHILTLYHTRDAHDLGLDIINIIDILKQSNFELAMRFTSHIRNGDTFYTDLNGFQITRRQKLAKIPLQGNFYPMPAAAFIEDSNFRLTIVSGQPLGVSSLEEGRIEVIQDRRLDQDDNRGLGQGVLDNKITPNVFRLLLEKRISCDQMVPSLLSYKAHLSSLSLLYPLTKMIWRLETPSDLVSSFSLVETELAHDLHLVSARTFDEEKKPSVGLVFHRTHLDACFVNSEYQSDGTVNLSTFLPNNFGPVMRKASLSFLTENKTQPKNESLVICHMDILSVILS